MASRSTYLVSDYTFEASLVECVRDRNFVEALEAHSKPLAAWPEAPKIQLPDSLDGSPLSYFLFATFIKTKYRDYIRLNFCEDVWRAQQGRTPKIPLKRYLQHEAPTRRTEVYETDLSSRLDHGIELVTEDMDYPRCSECCVGLRGGSLAAFRIALEKGSVAEDPAATEATALVMLSLMQQYWAEFLASPEAAKWNNLLWYQDVRQMNAKDFKSLRFVGRGRSGHVVACKHRFSGRLYAVKTMTIANIRARKDERNVLNELLVFQSVSSPFLTKLHYSFRTSSTLYFVMDLLPGGSLAHHLRRMKAFQLKEIRYFAIQMIMAIDALHKAGFLHRDVKPENCLLTMKGVLKLSDFGLATRLAATTFDRVGTSGYVAPEVLLQRGRPRETSDWFALGSSLVELATGMNPFATQAAREFAGERTGLEAIDFASTVMEADVPTEDPDFHDLCTRLLRKDPGERLGARGVDDLKSHAWFRCSEWNELNRPVFIPGHDLHFSEYLTPDNNLDIADEWDVELKCHIGDDDLFEEWDWKNKVSFQKEAIEYLIQKRDGSVVRAPANEASCCSIL